MSRTTIDDGDGRDSPSSATSITLQDPLRSTQALISMEMAVLVTVDHADDGPLVPLRLRLRLRMTMKG